MDTYKELAQYILPEVIYKSFDLTKVEKRSTEGGEEEIHLYVEEKLIPPDKRKDLRPNGFYDEMLIGDFPLRDRKVTIHARRRRWIDTLGKTISNDWDIVEDGTRLSPELVAFLKEAFR